MAVVVRQRRGGGVIVIKVSRGSGFQKKILIHKFSHCVSFWRLMPQLKKDRRNCAGPYRLLQVLLERCPNCAGTGQLFDKHALNLFAQPNLHQV